MAMSSITGEGVVQREVSFAYNSLRNAFDFLDIIIPNSPDNIAARNVDGISLDVIRNQVLISLAVYNEDKIYLFRSMVLDAPYLVFHQSPGLPTTGIITDDTIVVDEVYAELYELYEPVFELYEPMNSTINVRPGDRLYFRNPRGELVGCGSFGYRAVIDLYAQGVPIIGLMTASHLGANAFGRFIRPGDRVYNSAGSHVGSVVITHRDTIDAAFIAMAPGVNATNVVWHGAVLGRVAHAPIGSIVILDARHGRNRQGVVRGNWSGNTAIGWMSGVRASYASQDGDSGGIVYAWTSATNNGVVGITVVAWGSPGWADGGNSLFTLANVHSFLIGHDLWPS